MLRKTLLIVGVGSIGKKHYAKLHKDFDRCILVDPLIETIKDTLELNTRGKNKYLTSVKQLDECLGSHLAIISNLAPDHLKIVQALIEKNYSSLLIEKPISDSLKEIEKFRKIQKTHKTKMYVNIPWAYSSAAKILANGEQEELIGKVKSIIVTGGAKCISTNGIHYVSLANAIFKSRPLDVFASLNSSFINPRRADILFIAGCATWNYSQNRYLSINFQNESSISIRVEIICEFGKILFDKGKFHFEILEMNEAMKSSRTHTHYATIQDMNHEFSIKLNQFDGVDEIFSLFEKPFSEIDFENGIGCTEDLINALISNERRERICNTQDSKSKKILRRKWFIS